jgi:hypothetical protein
MWSSTSAADLQVFLAGGFPSGEGMTNHQLASSCHTGCEEAGDSIGVFFTHRDPQGGFRY